MARRPKQLRLGLYADLYGAAEVADRCGVKTQTVSMWLQRKHIPEPDAQLACGPVWLGSTLAPFFAQKGV